MKAAKLAARMADSHIRRVGVSKSFGGRPALIEFYTPYAVMIANVTKEVSRAQRRLYKTMDEHAVRVRGFLDELAVPRDALSHSFNDVPGRANAMVQRGMRDLDMGRFEVVLREQMPGRAMNGHGLNLPESDGTVPREDV